VQSGGSNPHTSEAQINYTTPGIKLMQSIYQDIYNTVPSDIVPLTVEANTSLVLSTPPSTLIGMQVLYTLPMCKGLVAHLEEFGHLVCKNLNRLGFACHLQSARLTIILFQMQDTAVATLVALYNGMQVPLSYQLVNFTFAGDTPTVVLQGTTDAQVTFSTYIFMCPFCGHSCA
jgi:hypothetical protein